MEGRTREGGLQGSGKHVEGRTARDPIREGQADAGSKGARVEQLQ